MNGLKPVVGVEFTDDYKEAKRKLIDFMIALDKLPPIQRDQLARECTSSMSKATSLQMFISCMYNGGYN